MFNKLLSNLPFNPSLIDQVSFYARRLRKEAGIRRLGFALVAMTMMVQVFAVMSPAEAGRTCDPSGNDVVQCGFETKAEAVDYCNSNKQDFATILQQYYGINCAALAGASERQLNSRENNSQLYSVGRKAFNKPGEKQLQVDGLPYTLFSRPLWSFDTGSSSTYRALELRGSDNQIVYILFECGNMVTIGDFKPKKPEPAPKLNITKSNSPKGDVKPGDILDYNLTFTNKGGTAAFFSVDDILPSEVTFVSSQNYGWTFENQAPRLKWSNKTPYYTFGNTDAFGTPGILSVKVKVNSKVPNGTIICNRAYVAHLPAGSKEFQRTPEARVCNTVRIKCPAGQILGGDGLTCKPVTVPDAACTSLVGILAGRDNDKQNIYDFEAKAETYNGATIKSYNYNFGDGTTKDNKSTAKSNKISHQYKTPGNYEITVKVVSSVADKPALTCKTQITVTKPGEPALVQNKKASNITKNIADANNTTASAGDVIEYTLTTKNITNVDAKDVVLQPEDLSDVLEYATLDLGTLQGGTFDAEKGILAWNSKITIKANQSVNKVFRVTVKNPIPSTPSPETANRSSGDLVMRNIYGNDVVEIKLPGTPIKTIEQTTTTLPNTGPGTSLLISFVTVTIVGYFFARSRLLATELEIVKNEYTATSGGY